MRSVRACAPASLCRKRKLNVEPAQQCVLKAECAQMTIGLADIVGIVASRAAALAHIGEEAVAAEPASILGMAALGDISQRGDEAAVRQAHGQADRKSVV